MTQRPLSSPLVLTFVGFLGMAASFIACSSSSTPAPPASTPTEDAGSGEEEEEPALTAYTEDEVQALFDKRCVKCHDASNDVLDLRDFRKATEGVAVSTKGLCGAGSKRVRIVPGDRNASLLWHKVKRTQDCGQPMPYDSGNPRLTAVELERLGLWIDALQAGE